MTDSKTAWNNRRPILHRLPQYGYQDNAIADALTFYPDLKLSGVKDLLERWYLELHPDTCQDASLDYLAYLVGFSGHFWDTRWSNPVKRDLIRASHAILWRKRGTFEAIRAVLDIHGISYDIWTDGSLNLAFTLSGTFGSPKMRYYLRLPKTTPRVSPAFQEARRTLRLYSPAVTKSKVTYQAFYLGLSRLGDPLF